MPPDLAMVPGARHSDPASSYHDQLRERLAGSLAKVQKPGLDQFLRDGPTWDVSG